MQGDVMKQVNMHDAKTHLSRLVEEAVRGEPFVIARNGTPLVTVQACRPEVKAEDRVGFMPWVHVPDDFDSMGRDEILAMFEGRSA